MKNLNLNRMWTGVALLVGVSTTALAVDGVILIDQARALAGNVTAGDGAGFPVSINQPGSYRLAGNLTVGDANTTAIEINAPGVTLDLNGFTISGPNQCNVANNGQVVCSLAGTGIGIKGGTSVQGLVNGIAIANGTIRGMGNAAIGMAGANQFARVANVIAIGNGGHGIYLSSGSIATGNVSTINRGDGITAGAGSLVLNNVATLNNGVGLSFVGASSGYAGNVLNGNAGGAVSGGLKMGDNVCSGLLCP